MNQRFAGAILIGLLLGLGSAWAAQDQQDRQDKDKRAPQKAVFHSQVPAYDVNVVLGRPTLNSVVANVYVQKPMNIEIRYGPGNKHTLSAGPQAMAAGSTHEFLLHALPPNSAASYALYDANSGAPINAPYSKGTFHTARSQGEGFTFAIQADSHLDGDTVPALYEQTLQNIAHLKPDFMVDLGDTFMADKIGSINETEKQYRAQRYYLGIPGHSVPLYMVLGNHDGIGGIRDGRKKHSELTDWSIQQRAKYFSTPGGDDFYQASPEAGQFHYAWRWGDALFVVLDPYSQSGVTKSGKEPWNMTLGKAQYDWLGNVLRKSNARFKFVFIHQLVSGMGKGGRGGLEAASLYEWGGHDEAGNWQFEAFRAGWEQPVHGLLRETGVSAVFHGHDHFFAHQVLDDISYVLVPQPAHRNTRNHHAGEYGYRAGTFLPNSGHVQVEVTTEKAVISYIGAVVDELKRPSIENGEVVFRYEIMAGNAAVAGLGLPNFTRATASFSAH